jgi:hypothetical protein
MHTYAELVAVPVGGIRILSSVALHMTQQKSVNFSIYGTFLVFFVCFYHRGIKDFT